MSEQEADYITGDQSEQDIRVSIIELLQRLGCMAYRVNSGKILIKDERGTRAFQGAPKGTADITALYHGRYMCVEVKRPGKKLEPEQETHRADVLEKGGIHFLAESMDDILLPWQYIGAIINWPGPVYYEYRQLYFLKKNQKVEKQITCH